MMAHRRLDVDGINNTGTKLIDRGRAREAEHFECSWHEACAATDTVLERFGDPHRDRGIWVWYCRRIGVPRFLDLFYDVLSCHRCGELKYPVRAFQKRLQDAFPKGGTQ